MKMSKNNHDAIMELLDLQKRAYMRKMDPFDVSEDVDNINDDIDDMCNYFIDKFYKIIDLLLQEDKDSD